MLTWPVDHPSWVCVALGVVALGFLVGLWTTRKRYYAIGLGAMAGLTALFLLLVLLVPTDMKRIRHAIDEMGAGVKEKNADRIFANISDQFQLGSQGKQAFRQLVDQALRSGEVTDIQVWNFRDVEISRPHRTATLVFDVKPFPTENFNNVHYRCKAAFVLDSDDQWRLRGFDLFNPFVETDKPLNVPELIPH
jgi:hypothetical protein